MPVFQYKGLNAQDKKVSGIVDAESPKSARQKLRKLQVYPTELVETTEIQRTGGGGWRLSLGSGVKPLELSVLTRQLSTLAGAGLPLVRCISALTDQADNPTLRNVLAEVREAVNEGSSLADALGRYPRIFSDLYVNMIRAGEQAGALEIVLKRLADFTESQADLRNKVLYATLYPAVILAVSFAVIFVMFWKVIPRIVILFEQTHQALPLLTRIMIALSGLVQNWWWLILMVLVGAGISAQRYLRTPAGREWFDENLLRVPVFGDLARKMAVSRFAKTLGTLLMSGIPLLRGLEIVEKVVNNTVLARAIETARSNITEGANIADPLRQSGVFPPFVIQMIASGEQSGDLEFMLEKASEAFDREVMAAIAGIMALVEPVMILGLAMVVGLIILSFLVPILNLAQGLG
jgi:general secretion pathway protein F